METKYSKALDLTVLDLSSHIYSPTFSSGGCEWIVNVNPEGNCVDNYLSLFLTANEPQSLGLNWKRKASFYFVLLNQSRKEISRTPESGVLSFCADYFIIGWPKAFPLKKVLKEGVSVKDRFVIEIYMKVVEVVDGSIYVNVNGFQVLSSRANSVKQIFVEHPDIALGLKPKNQVVKTEYMNVLLSLLETMKKPLKSISKTELRNANSKLCELTEVGFKLEWLETKLDEVKKAATKDFQIKKLEEHVKNLELTVSGLKVELDKEKAKSISDAATVFSLEKTLSDLKTELANEKVKSANLLSFKKVSSELGVELEKEKAKSTSTASKFLSWKGIWSGLKFKQDHKKGDSEITANLFSCEDGDLVSPTNSQGIQQKKKYGYKRIN